MTFNESIKDNPHIRRRELWQHISAGLRDIFIIHRWKLGILLVYLLLTILLWNHRDYALGIFDSGTLFFPALKMSIDIGIPILALFGLLGILVLIGTPAEAEKYHDRLFNAGFVNHGNCPPKLVAKYKKKVGNRTFVVFEFAPNGIPFEQWCERKNVIADALQHTVLPPERSKNGRRIILHTVPGLTGLKENLTWRKEYLSPEVYGDRINDKSGKGRENMIVSGKSQYSCGF